MESGENSTITTRRRKSGISSSSSNTMESPESGNASDAHTSDNNESQVKPKEITPDVTPDDEMDTSTTQETTEESARGRKRKASEVKDNSSVEESPPKKEDATELGNEPKPEEKDESSANESASESKDIKLPPKQMLGKGKRARIPNKRYSDIILSPHSKLKSNIANGDAQTSNVEKENVDLDSGSNTDLAIKSENSNNSSGYSSPALSSLKGSKAHNDNPSSPAPKKGKVPFDLSNPNYLKPFQYGWKRELVYRATNDNSLKRNGDIYYYTPSGKKLRSMREVSEHLKNKELTLDDFTFFKEPLGLDDPDKEIIRDAKYKTVPGGAKKTKSAVKISKPSTSKTVSTTPVPASSPEPPISTPKNAKLGSIKVKLSRRSVKEKNKIEKKPEEDMETASWSTPAKKSTATRWSGNNLNNVDNKPCRPCSIRCEGVSGLIPTLQCRLCLCLYHNECVGIAPHTSIQGYMCKNCQLDQDMSTGSTPAPPPLTPINTLKSMTVQSTALPKLQRIPKLGEAKKDLSKGDLPRLIPRPAVLTTVPKYIKVSDSTSSHTENKSLVGGVTTWFPPSSTIQLGSDQTRNAESSAIQAAMRPQFVEYLGDKKFIVIPKHNVLSVSPTLAATSSNASEENVSTAENITVNNKSVIEISQQTNVPDSARLDNDSVNSKIQNEICDIKIEPNSPPKNDNPQSTTTDFVEQPMDIDMVSVPSVNPSSVSPDLRVVEGKCTITTDEVQKDGEGNTTEAQESVTRSAKARRAAAKPNNACVIPEVKKPENKFMENYLQNLSFGYNTLLYVFQYLKVQDLLRAGCVCTMWRDIASHPLLWRTVRMKNSQVHSFEGLANTLAKHGTVHLDLRKMLLPNVGDETLWPSFSKAIQKVESLRKIELCRCPAAVVEQLATTNPNLEVINAVTIKCEKMNLEPLSSLKNLQELRLKSTAGLTLTSQLTALKELTCLKHLSLTSVKDLNKLNIEVIAELENLESLELGECTDFPKTFGPEILGKLINLEKLRLEKGQSNCYAFEILDAVKNMPKLEQLELVNFDIKSGFDKALGSCTNIKKLLIIPTYISQSATTNHMVLGGVLRLQSTLLHFVWGVTLELLRVTELFVDQCEDPDKKEKKEKKTVVNGDSIPVLKPVPILSDNKNDIPPAYEPPQVEILPLPTLQKLLLQSLPTTRVKILKIPFHATWRQSITDLVYRM